MPVGQVRPAAALEVLIEAEHHLGLNVLLRINTVGDGGPDFKIFLLGGRPMNRR